MFELVRSNDPVLLSYLTAGLKAAGISAFVFDAHTSSAYGGALPDVVRRVMVAERDTAAALRIRDAIMANEPHG
jgi:hypothetical protein